MERTLQAGCLALLVMGSVAVAADRTVSTTEQLAAALKDANAGDRVVLSPGAYALAGAEVAVAPLTVEASSKDWRPIIGMGDGEFCIKVKDEAGIAGAVLIRGLVFDGKGKNASALVTGKTRLEVEDCEFRDFSGDRKHPTVHSQSAGGKEKQGIRVSRCTFRKNPEGSGVMSVGPALVEDCTLENIRGGMFFDDWTGRWGPKAPEGRCNYKVVVRRNHIYRTEGTDWKCQAIFTYTTAPEVYENVIHDLSKGDCSAFTIGANGLDAKGIPTAALVYRNVIIDKWKAADSGMIHESIEYGEYHPTKGKIYENVLVARVEASPALYNKADDTEWFNNTLYGKNRLFHCTGFKCRYYNNIMFGGRADGSYYSRKDMETEKAKAEVEVATLEDSCFLNVEHIKDREFIKGKGYFEADPKFVDPENMDFHLRSDSPCINKGTGSRDGLTPTDLGAFEYPIQVCGFKVDEKGEATWSWANDFQKVSKRVRIRWSEKAFPASAGGDDGVTVAEADAAGPAKAATGKTSGFFAAFVLDTKDRWSGPTPDNVHRFRLGADRP